MPLYGTAGELEIREKVKNEICKMYLHEQFDELTRISQKYLETEERSPSGLWMLTLFNAGIGKATNTDIKNDAYWDGLEEKALRWVSFYPQSPSGYIAYANILRSRAWMYRGGGWARDVKEENWKPFYECLAKARRYLKKHYHVSSKDPRWYETMIVIAMGEGWEKEAFESCFNEAVEKFPYYYQIYFAATDYLLPKWHGSKEDVEKFAIRAVDLTKSKEKSSMYARIYWYSSQSNYGKKLFTDSSVIWSRMSKSIDDVLLIYPDQWNINNFAYFACLARDKEKAKSLIKKIEGAPILQVWQDLKRYNYYKLWASNIKEDPDIEPLRKTFKAMNLEFEQDGDLFFNVDDMITIKYYVKNSSNEDFAIPQIPLSYTLYTLQRLDNDGTIQVLPQASKFNGLPEGFGYNISKPHLLFPNSIIKKGYKFPFTFSMSTKGFNPGNYRLYIDLRLFDDNRNVIERKQYHIDFSMINKMRYNKNFVCK